MPLPRTATTFAPPVMEARRWLQGVDFAPGRPLINVSQAAPVDPPPAPLRQAMADVALGNDAAHLYGPVLGLPELRAELAAQTGQHYGGSVTPLQVCITSGCNQAFAAAIATLCAEGDEVILPTPWYFNHKMWLDMSGVAAVPLATGPDLLPDPDHATALITPRTRAIALVTPNNPGGVEYPAELVQAFFDLARDKGIALILDETYRDFDSRSGPPHALFQDPDGLGGYFAYMQHPFAQSAATLAPELVRSAGILCLPGTMFCPEGDATGERQLRIAFANLDAAGIGVLFDRLAELRPG